MLLASVVQLAHAQKLYVIAEGTETLAQFELAAASGCDAIQGYYLARPMTAPALEAWLSARDATQPGHDRRQTVHALPFDGGALKHGL
jgi:EAL domain-containing protein (putative c-di-GMP-specific phosphodiesterase class I)